MTEQHLFDDVRLVLLSFLAMRLSTFSYMPRVLGVARRVATDCDNGEWTGLWDAVALDMEWGCPIGDTSSSARKSTCVCGRVVGVQ